MPKAKHESSCADLDGLLHFCDVQLDVGIHLEVLVVGIVDLVFDGLFQVQHLDAR